MRLLLLKHFVFDDPLFITTWADQKGYSVTAMYPPDTFTAPSLDSFDLLIILGGPMSAYQESEFPWLTDEKSFIKSAVAYGKKVLGICLGAQMLAEVVGGRVYRNSHKEIGWHPVVRNGIQHPLFSGIPDTFHSFHWHGDCFDIPDEAIPLAYSEACRIQAFAYGERALGLQFHLETTPSCMNTMLARWQHEIIEAPYIQSPRLILEQSGRSKISSEMLHQVLNSFERMAESTVVAGLSAQTYTP
ncbi:MAG: glutamine amidotransferase [Paenibacillus sp.]|jgi:GMP synthase-like glutamine amidotransferase|nr:glutamine amidotransferase [Paenibacillus sp.]